MKFEELVDGHQTVPYKKPGALYGSGGGGGGVSCLVVLPSHFNPNNSLFILLRISLLFTCTPALTKAQMFVRFLSPHPNYAGGI